MIVINYKRTLIRCTYLSISIPTTYSILKMTKTQYQLLKFNNYIENYFNRNNF